MNDNPVTGDFTWAVLGTYTGAVAATMLISHALRQMSPWFDRIPAILLAYVIAAVLLVGADVFLPPVPTASSLLLCFVNAFGVAVTASGANLILGVADGRNRANTG